MRHIFSVQTISETETNFRQQFGEGILMERASFAIAARVSQLLRDLFGGVVGAKVLLLVGGGDNGGDALFAGTYLLNRGVDVRAIQVSEHMHELGFEAFRVAGGRFIESEVIQNFAPDVILDGIVGTGLRGPLRENVLSVIQAVNRSESFVVSIDVPSGVIADTGEVLGAAVQANVTLTIGAYKIGVFTGQGKAQTGLLDFIDIGVEYPASQAIAHLLDLRDLLEEYPPIQVQSYKYSRGVVGLNVGSEDYPGASLLAVGGALASGVGMVRMSEQVAPFVIEAHPEVVQGLHDPHINAFAIGSGGAGDIDQLAELLSKSVPVVIDAHALDFLSDDAIRNLLAERNANGVLTVMTPHAGEASRLGFSGTNRLEVAKQLAQHFQATVVLKGPGTIMMNPKGDTFVDLFGSQTLSSAGTGDVLAGLIAGSLATSSSPSIKTVASAVALHGLASRWLSDTETASDLVEALIVVRTDLQNTQE